MSTSADLSMKVSTATLTQVHGIALYRSAAWLCRLQDVSSLNSGGTVVPPFLCS